VKIWQNSGKRASEHLLKAFIQFLNLAFPATVIKAPANIS
jgi:hypothetical protein